MNGEEVKKINGTINRSSAISIGVVVVMIGATFWIVSTMTNVQAKVQTVEETVQTLDDDFVPRRELDQRLMNIESTLIRIEKSIIKK